MDMSTTMTVRVETTPFDGQKPGTSGLRKRVSEFQQPPGNRRRRTLLQSRGDTAHPADGGGQRLRAGDRRPGGLLSTPAASCLIRKYATDGGIILSASHNPGGPDEDFGIKFNIANGGPARRRSPTRSSRRTSTIDRYLTCEAVDLDAPARAASTWRHAGAGDRSGARLRGADGKPVRLQRHPVSCSAARFRMRFDAMHASPAPTRRRSSRTASAPPRAR
jgi:phosphoglucomutase